MIMKKNYYLQRCTELHTMIITGTVSFEGHRNVNIIGWKLVRMRGKNSFSLVNWRAHVSKLVSNICRRAFFKIAGMKLDYL